MTNNVLRSRAYGYTLADMISRVDMADGDKAEYTSDCLDRLTREKHTDYYGQVISDETYEYDLPGTGRKKRRIGKGHPGKIEQERRRS